MTLNLWILSSRVQQLNKYNKLPKYYERKMALMVSLKVFAATLCQASMNLSKEFWRRTVHWTQGFFEYLLHKPNVTKLGPMDTTSRRNLIKWSDIKPRQWMHGSTRSIVSRCDFKCFFPSLLPGDNIDIILRSGEKNNRTTSSNSWP